MDNLKSYAKNDDDLRLLSTVKGGCENMGIQFGLDKSVKVTLTII